MAELSFYFNKEIVKYLEEKAKREGKTQTQYLEKLIEKDLKEEKKAKRLDALEKLKGCATGKIGDIDLRQVRIDRAVYRAK